MRESGSLIKVRFLPLVWVAVLAPQAHPGLGLLALVHFSSSL